MSNDRPTDPLGGLTASDRERLSSAIERIERDLYRAVLARLTRTVLLALAAGMVAVSVFGWLAWSALRDRLAEDAVYMLQADTTLRADLLSGMGIDTAAASARLREALAQIDALTRQTGRGARTTEPELAEIQRMLDELLGDFRAELEPRRED